MRVFFKVFLGTILAALLVLFINLIFNAQSVIIQIFVLAGKADKISPVGDDSYRWIFAIRGGLLLTIISCTLILLKFDIVYSYANRFVKVLWNAFTSIFPNLKIKELVIILILPFAAYIFFGLTVPVSYDEAYTYLLFTQKPFYYCMIFYPYPNNHVLHSILTNITDQIPFLNTLFKIRIPTILASMATWIIGYAFVKKYYGGKVALFVVAISSILFLSIYYGFMSRGYALYVLFFVICLYAAFNILKDGNRRKDWVFFTLAGILGMYTMPSFLYVLVILNVLIFITHPRLIKKQFIYGIITAILTLLCYLPIILVDGLKALSNNQFVRPIERMEVIAELPSFFIEALHQLFSIPAVIMIAIITVSIIVCCWHKDWSTIKLWTIFLIMPFVLLSIHSVIPFHRTFLYYGFLILFLTGISFHRFINSVNTKMLLAVLLSIQVGACLYFNATLKEYEPSNVAAYEMNKRIIKEGKTYYFSNSITIPAHEFEMTIRGWHKNSVYDYMVMQLDADSIHNFDYVVVDKDKDETKHKKPIYENVMLRVYPGK